MRPPTCELNASVKAWPTLPTPSGSPVPRAKTTSMSGQGTALAAGAKPTDNAATADPTVARMAAPRADLCGKVTRTNISHPAGRN